MEEERSCFNQCRQVIKRALLLDRKWELKSIAEVEQTFLLFRVLSNEGKPTIYVMWFG